MVNEDTDTVRLVRIPSIDEHRSPRSVSVISYDNSNVSPTHVFDVLDEIYAARSHQKCIRISYYTLLSMTLAISIWMSYWIAYNRCENVKDHELRIFLCDLVILLETLTFILLGISPVLFVMMILFWINYSCHNPMDPIRKDGKLFRIEDDQWQEQLKYFYTKKQCRLFNCCRYKKRKELNERGYGYVILSSHGIVIDELILFSARKNIIDHGILLDNNKSLKLIFKKTWYRPWKIHIDIYLPEDLNHRNDLQELIQLLKIQNLDHTASSV